MALTTSKPASKSVNSEKVIFGEIRDHWRMTSRYRVDFHRWN